LLATRAVGESSHGIVCEPTPDGPAGPVALVPLLTQLLLTHIRRRAANDVIHLRALGPAIVLRYAPRPATQAPRVSWPLRLAAVALQTSAWEVWAAPQLDDEAVTLQPIGTRTQQ
jgi:hypothetical protein